jgi:polyisoprenoid-binding protein YceI
MDTAVKTTWGIDTAHSEVQFKVKHMMVSTVTGYFNQFDGSVESESEDFEGASIKFTAEIDSIDTRNEQRDAHLKSDDFFNAEAYPQLIFESTSFTQKENGNYRLLGNMTIRDITKEIEMDVEFNGTAVDPYGNTKAGFEINGKINRKDFGLKWNAITEAGSVVVSDEVRLSINVQLIKQ